MPPLAVPRCPFPYAAAMVVFALAFAIRLFALPLDGSVAFLTFYPGAVLTALCCGVGPAIAFVLLAGLTGAFVFIPPFWDLRFSAAESGAMLMFVVSAGGIVGIVASFERRMRRQNAVLQRELALRRRSELALQESEARLAADLAARSRTEGALRATSERLVQSIAELQLAKRDAERANNAKSRFLAAASHDLRQPLAAMSLYVGALDCRAEPPRRDVVDNMKGCIAHLNELLSDLLDISKLEAKAVEPVIRDFKVDDVLGKITASHGPQAAAKGLALRYRRSNAFGRTDPVLFQRIVGNLVSNAIRYSDRGGLLLACRQRAGKTWVEVWDTGIGIPADKTQAIFEEFIQLGNDERNPVKGTGLGLAIVAKTAALLNLEVRVRSQVERGSVFGVELPLGAAPSVAARRRHVDAPLHIALVEDNRDVAAALHYALQQDGHAVIVAADGDELMARLGAAPDVVVCDYRLAGKETGLDVIRRVRARFGLALPALVITGDTDPALLRRAREQAVRLVHKPLDIEALRTLLDAMRIEQAA